ncbi:MAG: heme A synthase [Acidobacteriota bacterium]
MARPTEPGRRLHHFALLTAAATFLLVIAGGLVTSTGSGLAVPDWPLSYGTLFPPMVGGIFYEHGHRMVAGGVGLMTMVLAIWLWLRDSRRWLRWLGVAAVLAVLIQATLGGMTVLFLLPAPISVGHAGLAMAFFSLIASLAVFTSPTWNRPLVRQPLPGSLPLPRLAVVATVAVYLQILLGAAVRHTGAGLACPDFPLCNGSLFPAVDSIGMGLHLAHRGGAAVATILVGWVAWRILRDHRSISQLCFPALIALALVVVQILLGALTIWSRLAVVLTTAHVAGGALLLVTMVILTLRSHRVFCCAPAQPAMVSDRKVLA